MYNEGQKLEYMKNLSNSLKATYNTLFEDLSYHEERFDTDICNIPPCEYLEILLSNKNTNRFSSYMNMFRNLLKYREDCLSRGLVDEKVLINELTRSRIALDVEQSYKIYSKCRPIENHPVTPDKLFNILKDTMYPNLLNDTVADCNYDELIAAFVIALFCGINIKEVSKLKRKDVMVYDDFVIVNNILLGGNAAKIFRKIIKANTISHIRGVGTAIFNLNNTYCFAFENESTEADLINRGKKIYAKFRKDVSRTGESIPTLGFVLFIGNIYRMCITTKEHILTDDKEILKLYKDINNIINERFNRYVEVEVINTYKDLYYYLRVNNWPY